MGIVYAAGSTEKPGVILNLILNLLSEPVLPPVSTVTIDEEKGTAEL